MANNMLSSLGAPDSKALRHLEYLNLESNLLDWNEVSLLSSLPKLNTLVLTTNKLTGIGAALDGFVSLTSLYVNRNAIDSVRHLFHFSFMSNIGSLVGQH